jgi:hypothetical protein
VWGFLDTSTGGCCPCSNFGGFVGGFQHDLGCELVARGRDVFDRSVMMLSVLQDGAEINPVEIQTDPLPGKSHSGGIDS